MKNSNLKLLFIDIPKTAGTAIIDSFQIQFPDYLFEGKHHSIRNFIAYGTDNVDEFGRPSKGKCSVVTRQDLEDLRTFSVIRNPYDRMVSLWLWGSKTIYDPDFDRFVSDVADNRYHDFNQMRYKSQVEWISDAQGVVRVRHLLRFESLARDFSEFLIKLGIEPFRLLTRNTAFYMTRRQRSPFNDYYSSELTRQTVEHLWADDFQMFGYEKI